MTIKNNKISVNQLCVLLLSVFTSMRPILENSIQAKFVENDCVVTSIIAGIINICLALLICYVMNKNPGKSFYDIMKNFMGEIITKIIMLCLAFIFVFKILIVDYQMNFLLYDAIYSDIDWILFTLPICLMLAFLAIKGIKTIARTYQVFLPFAMVILIAVFFISYQNADFENLLPLFNHRVADFSQALIYILIQSCEYLFLLTFMENVISNDKNYYLKIILALICAFILVTTFYVLFVAVLGKIAPYVQETLIKMTQFKDNSFGYFKVDIFVTVFLMPMAVLQNSLAVYSFSYCINKAFNISTNIASIGIVSLLLTTHFVPFINNQSVTNLYYKQIGIFVLIFILLLPVLLLIASFKKERAK